MFSQFDKIFTIAFIISIVIFAVVIINGIRIWINNNNSPRLTVFAEIVGKRMSITDSSFNDDMSASTTYYVTFQVERGDRMEFLVNGREYGMLAEGDKGKLSFQGTRYLSFERM